MADCRTFFVVPIIPAVTPSVGQVFWQSSTDLLFGCINFDEDMDNTVLPPASKLRFLIGVEPANASQIEWSTNRVMSQFKAATVGFGTDVNLQLPVSNSKYRTALGAIVEPYDLDAVDLNLTSSHIYNDPTLTIFVDFDFDMDIGVMPTLEQIRIIADGIPFTPAFILWGTPTRLVITLFIAEFVLDTLTIELLEATNNMITIDGAVICKWLVDATN